MNEKSTFRLIILFLISILSVSSIIISGYLFFSRPRIAYVYNSRVLTEYKGVKEGRISYDKKVQAWQSNLDTLGKDLSEEIRSFEKNYNNLNSKDRNHQGALLKAKEQELINYKKAIEKKASEEEQEMSASVLNQINSYILDYGKQSGYDYIFGVTDNGNLLYAREGDDITEIVIKNLNAKYAGE